MKIELKIKLVGETAKKLTSEHTRNLLQCVKDFALRCDVMPSVITYGASYAERKVEEEEEPE